MLRIVLGFKADQHRESDPAVLYAGHDGDAAQAAVDAAPAEYVRLERAEIPYTQRAKRSRGVEPQPTVAGAYTYAELRASHAQSMDLIDRLRGEVERLQKELAADPEETAVDEGPVLDLKESSTKRRK